MIEPTTWAELVAAAVPGTARRQPPASAWPTELGAGTVHGDDAAYRLLSAGALATAARRAGAQPTALAWSRDDPVVGQPAEPETLQVAPDLARWFGLLLTHDRRLLPALLEGMAARGLIFPAAVVPAVLDHGVRDPSDQLTGLALATTGRRGAWLAPQHERWRRYAAHAAARRGAGIDEAGEGDRGAGAADDHGWQTTEPTAGPTTELSTGPTSVDDTVWQEGDTPTRIAWLRELAASRPELAHPIVAAALTGRGESADVRERIVALLGQCPVPGDVDLLEAALDDRAVGVRRAAARVLADRPEPSPFQQRMAERALAWVRLGQQPRKLVGGGGPLLVIDPPEHVDAAATRDHIDTETPVRGAVRGDGARRVHAAVAATPLTAWAPLGSPAQLLRLPVTDGWADIVHQGWARRAAIERDSAWADALLESGVGQPGAVAVLGCASPATRDAAAVARLRLGAGDGELPAWLSHLPHPWSPQVWAGFLAALPSIATGSPYHWAETLARIALAEPTERAADLAAVLHGPPGVPDGWVTRLRRCVDTLVLRAELSRALDEAASRPATAPPSSTPDQTGSPRPEGDPP